MKPIERTLKLLNEMFKSNSRFIMGSNGEYGWATYKLNDPISLRKIDDCLNSTTYKLPEDYKHFLTIHNGGYLFETEKDIKIELFNLEEMINFSAEYNNEEGIITTGDYWIIGQINEKWMIIDKNKPMSFNNPYMKIVHPSDGLETAVELNMNFERFLECAIIAQGDNFWEWNDEFAMIGYEDFSNYGDVEV